MKNRGKLASAVFFLTLFVFSGCGNGLKYKIVTFEGTLTFQGKPLNEQVAITFTPGEGRPSSAITDVNGKFKAEYTDRFDGVQVGKIKVTIEPYESSGGFQSPDSSAGKKGKSTEAQEAFAKYGFGSEGFEIDVQKKSTDYKLDLP